MKYDWNTPLLTGTIVCAKYNDFEGNNKVGIFFILYDEQLDNNVYTKKNVIAFKVSSRSTLVSNYSVELDLNRNDFLDKPCLVCCSKLHLLHKEQNIYKVLGKVDKITCKNVFKTYYKFKSEVEKQFVSAL